jgi:hypothetical protein
LLLLSLRASINDEICTRVALTQTHPPPVVTDALEVQKRAQYIKRQDEGRIAAGLELRGHTRYQYMFSSTSSHRGAEARYAL